MSHLLYLCLLTLILILKQASINAQINSYQLAKVLSSDGASGDRFGYSIAIDGDYAVMGAYGDASYRGSAYVLQNTISGWKSIAKLTASDGAVYDYFGRVVAISGDQIVVGAHGDDDNGSSSGSAYVFEKPTSGWTNMTQTAKLTASDGASYVYFSNSVAISGNQIVVGAYGDDDNGSYSGATYVFEKPTSGWTDMTQTAKLTASDGAVYDFFGISVAISDNQIVVGAYGDDDNGSSSGSAYVFEKSSSGWTQKAKLTASDGAVYDQLSVSVAISGDQIVVGASGDDDNGSASGSAYVFEKPTSGWKNMTQTAKLTTSDGATEDYFGFSVAISGDQIVVGASGDDDNGSKSGSAYLFEKPSSGWTNMTQTAKLITSDGAIEDYFGNSVAISGNQIVVGAHGDDDNESFSGSAYVFGINNAPTNIVLDNNSIYENEPIGTAVGRFTTIDSDENDVHTYSLVSGAGATDNAFFTISNDILYTRQGVEYLKTGYNIRIQTNDGLGGIFEKEFIIFNGHLLHKIVASDGVANGQFGISVAIDGNYAVVGAIGDTNYRGSAYVLQNTISGWKSIAKLTASDRAVYDHFGRFVAISDDQIVVGTDGDDDNGSKSGSAYVFEKPASGWTDMTQTAKLTASDGATEDYFGYSVAISDNQIVVGAYGDDDNGSSSGSAYVFEKPVSGWTDMTQTAKLATSDGAAYDYFGFLVAISEGQIVVGAYGDDDNGSSSGSAYVFEKSSSGWTQKAKLATSDGVADDYFGISVAILGDQIVVGAFGDDDNGSASGSAYVFKKPTSGWANMTQNAKLLASDGASNDQFGRIVGISGNQIVVGASGDDDKGSNSGSAYVFEKPSSGWANMTQTDKLLAPDGASNDRFGSSVAVDGNYAIVGVSGDDDKGSNSGSAYVFRINNAPTNIFLDNNSIYENEPTGTAVGRLTTIDSDKNDVHTYSLVSGTGATDNALFTISNDILYTQQGIEYLQNAYNIRIQTNNSLGGIFEKEFIIFNGHLLHKIVTSDGVAGDHFGYSVAIDGDYAVVGAIGDTNYTGSAYVLQNTIFGMEIYCQTHRLRWSN